MKIKPWVKLKKIKWVILLFLGGSIIGLLGKLVTRNLNNSNWQFLVKNQVGAQSILNLGKNLTFDEQNVFFGDDKNTIYSLKQKNGQLNWKTKLPNHTPFQITQDQNSLYVANFDSHIYKIDKHNGYIEWSFTIPNFFWPDTEVIFDESDDYVFFGDRGGFVHALDKKSGQQVWQQKFGTIDSTKAFIKKEIHLGFLKQNEDELILEHFPQQTIYILDKKTGTIKDKHLAKLHFQISPDVRQLDFENSHLLIKNNVIQQPQLVLVDQNWNQIWSYQVPFKTNPKEFYQFKDRIFYLDANNQVLTSILISDTLPLERDFHQLNFTKIEDFSTHEPYKEQHNPNPQINFQEHLFSWYNWRWQLKKRILAFNYFLRHFQQMFDFQVSQQQQPEFTELTLHHQDNFYKNKFTQVNINAQFINQDTHQEINIKGFYFDKDTWKIRAKLKAGEWKYQLKIKTPFIKNKFAGTITVATSPSPQLKTEGNSLVLDDELFIPLGLQTSIIERNQDGNPLNQIGYSDTKIPPTDITQQKFLPWEQYLATYHQQAGLNIFRYGPDNWAPAIWEDLSNPQNFAMKINGGLYGDYLLKTAKKHYYQTLMSIFSFYPPYITTKSISDPKNQQTVTQYLDYIIARYASLVDIWELSNEALPSQEWQNFVSNYLYENDPYKHPITTSLENPNLKNSHLLSRHEYIPIPKNNQQLVTQITKFYNQYPDWHGAQIISEFGFQGSNYTADSADWLRKFAWIFAMNKTGVIFWNTGERLNQNPNNANTYLGPTERKYLKVINEILGGGTPLATPKSKLKFDLAKLDKETNIENYRDEENQVQVYGMVDEKNGIEIYYLLKLKNNNILSGISKISLSLEQKLSFTKQIQIINPKSGNIIKKYMLKTKKNSLSIPDFQDDLVIKVRYD